MEQVIAKILDQGGLLGALLLFFGFYIYRLQRALTQQQDARVKDAKDYANSLLDINREWGSKLDVLTATAQTQKEYQERMLALVKDLRAKR